MRRTGRIGELALVLCAALLWPCVLYGQALCGNLEVEPGESCDDGNTFGGDGCAMNCQPEVVRSFVIDPVRSFAATQLALFEVKFSLSGVINITAAREPSEDGFVPFVIRTGDVTIERVSVPGLACACTIVAENVELYGPGNAGFGGIECGSGPPAPDRFFRVPKIVHLEHDHNTADVDPLCEQGMRELAPPDGIHPGICNGRLRLMPEGTGEPGSAVVVNNLTIRLIRDGGTCFTDPNDRRKGPDGVPCTGDDPVSGPDAGQLIRIDPAGAFTGVISGAVRDANNVTGSDIARGERCGPLPCHVCAVGEPLDCDALLADRTGPIRSGALALAFPILDAREIGDSVVTVKLVPEGAPVVCPGDCSGDGRVSVDELVRGVAILLGRAPLTECPGLDLNANCEVSVDEITRALVLAREGCP